MTKAEIAKFLILRTIGNFLVIFSLYGFVTTFGPAVYYELSFRITQARGVEFVVSQDSESGFRQILRGSKEQVLIPKDTLFSILIPKIGASAKVFPNIDPSNKKEFLPVLQKGVAHARGSVFPGIKGNTYLFAHSTDNFWNVGRYNAIFYLLKDLEIDDDVIVFFENKRYNYEVSDSKIAEASEVDDLVKAQETLEQKLVLQTCWPPGTTWKRLIVTAVPK